MALLFSSSIWDVSFMFKEQRQIEIEDEFLDSQVTPHNAPYRHAHSLNGELLFIIS